MKTIFKYELEVTDYQSIMMPIDAKILCIQEQYRKPCIWAEVNEMNGSEERNFEIFGTGNPIHEDMGVNRYYISTIQIGSFVWHIYERI